ncbi:MAG: hypothetical protein U0326_09755 [Polyangiales bacterium]
MLAALSLELGVTLPSPVPPQLAILKLDGYASGPPPVLVEVFAHVGPSKGGQRHKIAHDMTKLLLAEKLLDVPCRKVIAVIDEAAVSHLRRGWNQEFAERFGIEVCVVPGFENRHEAMLAVQARQRR